eukprot:UN01640
MCLKVRNIKNFPILPPMVRAISMNQLMKFGLVERMKKKTLHDFLKEKELTDYFYR